MGRELENGMPGLLQSVLLAAGLAAIVGGVTVLATTRSTPGRLVAIGLILLAVTLSWLLYEDMSGTGMSGAMSRELPTIGGRRS